MFFKRFKKVFITFLTLFIIPINTLAYSNYIIAGGENIGISINSKGVLIIGKYSINGKNINNNLKNGDIITKINNKNINNIEDMTEILNNNDNINITYIRDNKEYTTKLELINENGIIKTGLYGKDNITGIGTLSFIDPNTKLYGALGHEVAEKNTGIILEVKDGKIFESTVTSIDRSSSGNPGSKEAILDSNKINGTIEKNTTNGIFGKYTDTIPNKHKYKVANPDNIKLGKAKILTVINNKNIKEYDINIIRINKKDNNNKNILFEITDKELLNKTGGIVQGMSGSPIIQDNFIIGAVNHVIVDSPTNGYGIFITKMLEEAEK